MAGYVGRFAPSPTGPLHAGSLVAALASWLDARAHAGRWLVRIEDVDTPRCSVAAGECILQQLAACGLTPDEAPIWQSRRGAHYAAALDQLRRDQRAYPCHCTRQTIQAHWDASGRTLARHAELPYPGTCRGNTISTPPCSWRFRLDSEQNALPRHVQTTQAASILVARDARTVVWTDRRLGPQQQDVETMVGDFVLQRADKCFTYQLAVVVDDAAQDITHVVRGEDLADNTPRQILLQAALGLPTPCYLHTPLVLAADGEKLSKQNGAEALATDSVHDAHAALAAAAATLGLQPVDADTASHEALLAWTHQWRERQRPSA